MTFLVLEVLNLKGANAAERIHRLSRRIHLRHSGAGVLQPALSNGQADRDHPWRQRRPGLAHRRDRTRDCWAGDVVFAPCRLAKALPRGSAGFHWRRRSSPADGSRSPAWRPRGSRGTIALSAIAATPRPARERPSLPRTLPPYPVFPAHSCAVPARGADRRNAAAPLSKIAHGGERRRGSAARKP